MPAHLLPSLVSCIVSAVLAAAVVARDSRLRVNRLMGLLLACTSFWAFCEVVWNLQTEPAQAAQWIRFSSIGWIWLGPVCLHIFVEMIGVRRSRFARALPWTVALAVVANALYVLTPLGISEVVQTRWGWGYHFGPLFPFAYAAGVAPLVLVLASWRHAFPALGGSGERNLSRAMFAGVAFALAVASLFEVTLPALGVQTPRLGSPTITCFCIAIAWLLRRYGYSLLSPGACADEILQTLRDGVALADRDGRIRYANTALERLVGARSGGLVDLDLANFLPDRSVDAGAASETRLRGADGTIVPVRVASSPLRIDGDADLGEALVVRDFREVGALRSRLVTAGRLAAVGEISSNLVHEINDPLADAHSHLGELRRRWQDLIEFSRRAGKSVSPDGILAEGEELIDESLQGVERVRAIVRDVQGFSRDGDSERELADLDELVARAVRVGRARAGDGVRVRHVPCELPPIQCAPQKIVQVLLNLLLNAIHAVEGNGEIRLETQTRGGRVVLEIEDDGGGIPPEVRDRIFDPFFTTKPVGEGTGLGLSISYHIIRSHGGDIRVDSEPGGGTLFTIELPAFEPPPARQPLARITRA